MALPDFRIAGTKSGGNPEVRHYTVKAAETFSRGQVVKIDTATGHIEEGLDSGANNLGVAMGDAATHLADGTQCPVAIFNSDTIWSAKNTGAAFVLATHQNNKYDLEVAAGVHGVDVGTAGANAVFKVLGTDSTEAGTGVAERVLVSTIDAGSEGVDLDPI